MSQKDFCCARALLVSSLCICQKRCTPEILRSHGLYLPGNQLLSLQGTQDSASSSSNCPIGLVNAHHFILEHSTAKSTRSLRPYEVS